MTICTWVFLFRSHETDLRSDTDSVMFLDHVCVCLSLSDRRHVFFRCPSIFFIVQSNHIVRIVDSKIFEDSAPVACILMELGDMDFDKYLQSPAAGPEEAAMPQCQDDQSR